MTSSQGKLTVADVSVIVGYIISVITVGLWSMFQSKRGTIRGYFLAGRFMTFLPVGMSLFASNIGSEHLVGLAGSGAAAGIGVSAFEINALLFLQLLGFVFLPVYIASGACTLPEYIHKRFGGNRIRVFLSLLSLLLYVFTKISVNMYSGALFIQQSVGWNLYVAIIGLLVLTGICTITGGLATVIYLDTLMAFIMVGGGSILTIIGFQKIGGYSNLRTNYMNALPDEALSGNTTCGVPNYDSFVLLREPVHSDIPWPGFLFGQSTASIWYWCADQVIVQRALAAKSLSHAQAGTILAGFIKILPMFIMLMPGMISRVLFPNEVACVDREKCFAICGSYTGCSNIALPKLVLEIMPSGLRGLMLAVMMAALMSDLTSIFNSASTLFTMDIYRLIRRKAGTRELMIVGRVFVIVLCAIGMAWVPIMKEVQGGQLFIYIQSVSSYFSPPIAAVYLMAIIWPRSNEQGTFWAMLIGFILGIIRMGLDLYYPTPLCGEEDNRPSIVKDVHYFYAALIIFLVTGMVCVTISLMTEKPKDELIVRTTVWTKYDDSSRRDEIAEERELQVNDIFEKNAFGNSVNNYGGIELEERKGHLSKDSNEKDDSEDEKENGKEQNYHLKDLKSLQQNPIAKTVLRVLLIFIILVSIFLQVYFSIPDQGPTKPTISIPYLPFIVNGTRPNDL